MYVCIYIYISSQNAHPAIVNCSFVHWLCISTLQLGTISFGLVCNCDANSIHQSSCIYVCVCVCVYVCVCVCMYICDNTGGQGRLTAVYTYIHIYIYIYTYIYDNTGGQGCSTAWSLSQCGRYQLNEFMSVFLLWVRRLSLWVKRVHVCVSAVGQTPFFMS